MPHHRRLCATPTTRRVWLDHHLRTSAPAWRSELPVNKFPLWAEVSSLGGSLRWASSERQYADLLTKMSSQSLLAERIRFHKMKLVWDSQYVSSKKKTAEEREASRNEFAMPKEKKSDSQPTTFSTSTTQPTSTIETPLNTNMFEECDAEMNEQELDELYEPVEAYAGFPANVKMTVYALTCYTVFPAASALHELLDHEHGRWGI